MLKKAEAKDKAKAKEIRFCLAQGRDMRVKAVKRVKSVNAGNMRK
jgi:hypothetical protein